MEIREVRPQEYEEAGRVTSSAYDEFTRPGDQEWIDYHAEIADIRGRADRTVVLGAFDGDRCLGTATIEMDQTIGDDDRDLPPEMGSLRMLGVDPEARGRGAGKALMEASLARARAAGKTVMVLRTTGLMEVARGMYERMGFVRDPQRDQVVDDGLLLIAYRLDL
jgi:ribosomal protein S18 acetylase RimI-like enzyme